MVRTFPRLAERCDPFLICGGVSLQDIRRNRELFMRIAAILVGEIESITFPSARATSVKLKSGGTYRLKIGGRYSSNLLIVSGPSKYLPRPIMTIIGALLAERGMTVSGLDTRLCSSIRGLQAPLYWHLISLELGYPKGEWIHGVGDS